MPSTATVVAMFEVIGTVTLLGSSSNVVTPLSPFESRAVKVIRYDVVPSYPWPVVGIASASVAPVPEVTGWVWSSCLNTTFHESDVSARVPSSASVACPVSVTVVPAPKDTPALGGSMTGTGLVPIWMVIGAAVTRSTPAVTVSWARYTPGALYT